MRRRKFIALFGLATFAWPIVTGAQQGEKVYKIGVLSAGSPTPTTPVVVEALRALGYLEGKNLTFERRYAEDRLDRLPKLAAELISLKVDVIMTAGTLAPLAAKRATSTIPIVMMAAGDPVGSGLVASLAQPGGNITGMRPHGTRPGWKAAATAQRASRRTNAWDRGSNAGNTGARRYGDFFGSPPSGSRLAPHALSPFSPVAGRRIDGAFEAAMGQRTDALITVEDPLTIDLRKKIAEYAADHRLPTISGLKVFADAGALMSYGADLADILRRSVAYVDKILKGAKPADLPVEQPTKFELVINLKTAKSLGLTIPPLLLARADEVIE